MLTRKSFLKVMAASGVSAYVATRTGMVRIGRAAQSPQIPLKASSIPQFVEPLLGVDTIVAGTGQVELDMTEFQTKVLPTSFYTALPAPYNNGTYVWGYLQTTETRRDNYLGPVIVATRGTPTEIKFVNNLGGSQSTNVLAYKYSTDQTLHWADPLNGEMNMWNHMAMPPMPGSEGASNYDGPIPACPHLHGGYVPPVLDGGPDAWFTSDGQYIGHGFYSRYWDGTTPQNYCIYRYPNDQEGTLIWFHDHTLGATRLNVYCGLAGGYLIQDPDNDPPNLPPLVPLVIQDRMFDTNGQWFFPADSAGGVLWALNPEHPYWVPEFIGDTILVNGKTWPYLNVEPKRYTFTAINGSNARTYEISLIDPVSKNVGPSLWAIGTDGGYLDNPVEISPLSATNNKLVIMPGERFWFIIDFKNYQAGMIGPNGSPYSGNWLLKNTAKAPYPGGASPNGATTGKIMQFRVTALTNPDTSYDPASGGSLRGSNPVIRLSGASVTRQLTLNEIMGMPVTAIDPVTGNQVAYPGGPLEILVNNTKWDGKQISGEAVDPVDGMLKYIFATRSDFTLDQLQKNYLSEIPVEGTTEIWEIVNMTADAHPIHTHLAQFQLINRQGFNTSKYTKAYAAVFPAGYDFTMHMNMGPGAFLPAYGPPLNYATGNPRALGGNPDITPYLQGPAKPPLPQENGWKDTVLCPPGQVTRFIIRWALQDVPNGEIQALPFDPRAGGGGYVWHCHIVDHEDNEMMRPDEIQPIPGATRDYQMGVDY